MAFQYFWFLCTASQVIFSFSLTVQFSSNATRALFGHIWFICSFTEGEIFPRVTLLLKTGFHDLLFSLTNDQLFESFCIAIACKGFVTLSHDCNHVKFAPVGGCWYVRLLSCYLFDSVTYRKQVIMKDEMFVIYEPLAGCAVWFRMYKYPFICWLLIIWHSLGVSRMSRKAYFRNSA